MALTKEEREQLKALQAKEKEPEAPKVGRSLSIAIDLGDPDQVARAQKYGLLPADDDGDGDGDGDGDDDDEDTPKRRGYFPDE